MWDLLNWTCESIFIFLLYYAFFSPLCHARYDIILARGQRPQHRHWIASKARSTRYLLYVACTPCVACTVRLVLMCSILYAQAPSSQTFFLLFVFFSLMRSPLVVLVLYTEFLFTTDFVSSILYHTAEYFVYKNSISPARQASCVTSHMYYS